MSYEFKRMLRDIKRESAANAERTNYINNLVTQRWTDFVSSLPIEEQKQIANEEKELAELHNEYEKYKKSSDTVGVWAMFIFLFCITFFGPVLIYYVVFEKLGMTFLQSMLIYGVPFLYLVCRCIYFEKKMQKNNDKTNEIRNNGLCTKRKNDLVDQVKSETSTRIACSPWRGSPYMYEQETAKYFQNIGYTQVSVTPGSGDFGADVLATSPDGKRVAIQCKQYSSLVGQAPLQQVLGAMQYYHCDIGYVVTSTGYTKAAKELAKQSGIILYISNDISWELDEVSGKCDHFHRASGSSYQQGRISSGKKNVTPLSRQVYPTKPMRPTSTTEKSSESHVYNFVWMDTPDSYCFTKIAYDSTYNVLGVTFRASGVTYAYKNFTFENWQQFKGAPSNGAWYKENIKGKYEYERL